ncbi:MAG: glycoside hydrolase family 25 protein [Terriglobia bacterium]
MPFPAGAIPGIDVSHYQAVVDWNAVAAGGVRFGFAKASEGMAVPDQYFLDNWNGMKTAGLLRGAYHFFHPNADPQAQATNFLNRLTAANGGSPVLAPGDLPAALDIEVTDGASPSTLLTGASSWLAAVEAATGKHPIVYSYPSFWKSTLGNPEVLAAYHLWIAHLNVASPTVPGGWQGWVFWQYDKQPVHGVPSPTTDLNAFNGTYDSLQSLAA